MPADVVVVGAGISGSVIAERYAAIGKKVLVLEKRDHIGGNCYDYYNADGIQVSKYGKLFYTGPIDQFFNYRLSSMQKLEYRSIQFVHETLDQEFFQAHAVINYPNDELFTRIVEYKHITGQTHPHTTIVKEFTTDDGEPYYPVPNPQNQKIYHMYQRETLKLKDIYFVGRLANYKYFNMDEAFKNALDLFTELHKPINKLPNYWVQHR